jgi:type I restriction enzyme S subunit
METKKIPEIRFSGFDDEWQLNNLSEIIELEGGRDYKHLRKGNIPVYGTGGYMLSVNEALSNKDSIGIGRKGTIDKPYILRAPFWTVDTLFYAVPKNKNDLQFLTCIFKNIDWKHKDESTGVPSLSKVTINSVQTYTAKPTEQIKIGSFFEHLDQLINQHQTQHKKLNALKKAMLSKLFPKEGQTVPEIRFKGFTDDWVIKKLGDISKIKTGSSNRIDSTLTSKYTFFDRSDEIRTSDIFLFDSEAIIVPGEGADFIPKYFKGKFDLHQRVYAIINFDKTDGKYLFHFINYHRKHFLNKAVGSTVKSLRLPMFQEMIIMLPQIKEQQKIGNYFQNLDNLIENHHKQTEKLSVLKKACLSKMFV